MSAPVHGGGPTGHQERHPGLPRRDPAIGTTHMHAPAGNDAYCALKFKLEIPAGWQFTGPLLSVRGFAGTDTSATATATYSLGANAPLTTAMTPAPDASGKVFDNFAFTADTSVWSPCGGSTQATVHP